MSSQTSDGPQPQSVGEHLSTETAAPAVTDSLETAVDVDAALDPDRLFDVLKNQRRRRSLRYLIERDDPVSIGTLAEHIAALENDTTPEALTTRERKRVYVGLYQCHLPKLDDVNAIDFDKARGTITLGATGSQFEPYLDADQQPSRAWFRYYLLLAGVGGLLFLIQSVIGSGIPSSALLAGILGGFVVLSVVHLSCVSNRVSSLLSALDDH